MKLKYLSTVLWSYEALTHFYFFVCYSPHGATLPLRCGPVVVPLGHNPPATSVSPMIFYSTSLSTVPAPIITLIAACAQILLTAIVCRLDYISLVLFRTAALIQPLTISFCSHNVTMKDAGSKLPSLQHPSSQLASLRSIMANQALCD